MRTTERIARRLYLPVTRRIDGVLWRLEMLERHRAEDRQRAAGLLETGGREIIQEVARELRAAGDEERARTSQAFERLNERLDQLERRLEASHGSQVDGSVYLARVIRQSQAPAPPAD